MLPCVKRVERMCSPSCPGPSQPENATASAESASNAHPGRPRHNATTAGGNTDPREAGSPKVGGPFSASARSSHVTATEAEIDSGCAAAAAGVVSANRIRTLRTVVLLCQRLQLVPVRELAMLMPVASMPPSPLGRCPRRASRCSASSSLLIKEGARGGAVPTFQFFSGVRAKRARHRKIDRPRRRCPAVRRANAVDTARRTCQSRWRDAWGTVSDAPARAGRSGSVPAAGERHEGGAAAARRGSCRWRNGCRGTTRRPRTPSEPFGGAPGRCGRDRRARMGSVRRIIAGGGGGIVAPAARRESVQPGAAPVEPGASGRWR